MNKIERLEKENRLAQLKARDNELKTFIAENEVLEDLEKFDKERKENAAEMLKLENELTETPKDEGKPKMNYLENSKSIKDFVDVVKNNAKGEAIDNAWKAKLQENGVEITDDKLLLPKKIVEAIQTSLLEANPVFKVFRLTHVGALLVTQTFDSNDGANVHKMGEAKKMQNATLVIDDLKPAMIYKLQSIHEYVKRLNANYTEIYNLLVAEMTQAIVNKIVDLALVEGDGTNGFKAVQTEKDTKKVAQITATAGDSALIDAVEEAVDFVRSTAGRKYLIVTATQRKQIRTELRAAMPNVRLRNNDADFAAELGVDEIIVYTGKQEATLKPIVIVQDAAHIDMEDLTKVDAFKWETNENAILIEGLAAGHAEKLKGAAVITLP